MHVVCVLIHNCAYDIMLNSDINGKRDEWMLIHAPLIFPVDRHQECQYQHCISPFLEQIFLKLPKIDANHINSYTSLIK